VSPFLALLCADLRLVWRRPGDVGITLGFFVVVATLFPLGVGPEPNMLARIGPGVLWTAALFSSLLSLDRLFARDFADGGLEQLALQPWPLELAVLARCAAHWLTAGLPLALLTPFLGPLFHLDMPTALTLSAALLLGTPTLTLLGALGAALTLGAARGGALLALLVLPLCVPALIFGVGAAEAAALGEGALSPLALLGATSLATLAATPWAIAAALRQALE
jgi:heme exporter protein B